MGSKEEARADLEQRRQVMLGLLAAIEQQRAAHQTDREQLSGWQAELQGKMAYWGHWQAILALFPPLIASAEQQEPPDTLARLAALREEAAGAQEAIAQMLPGLLRTEARVNAWLAGLDDLLARWEEIRQQVLVLYDQTKGEI